jgi:hypothetical protein
MTLPSRLSFFTAYSIPRLDYKRPHKEKRPPPYRVPGPDGRASPLDDMPLIPAPTPAASLAGASCGRPPELSSSTLGGPQRPKPRRAKDEHDFPRISSTFSWSCCSVCIASRVERRTLSSVAWASVFMVPPLLIAPLTIRGSGPKDDGERDGNNQRGSDHSAGPSVAALGLAPQQTPAASTAKSSSAVPRDDLW